MAGHSKMALAITGVVATVYLAFCTAVYFCVSLFLRDTGSDE